MELIIWLIGAHLGASNLAVPGFMLFRVLAPLLCISGTPNSLLPLNVNLNFIIIIGALLIKTKLLVGLHGKLSCERLKLSGLWTK
jgi:hypothetical protein